MKYDEFCCESVSLGQGLNNSDLKYYQRKYLDECYKIFMDEFDKIDHAESEMFKRYVVEKSLYVDQVGTQSTQSLMPRKTNALKKGFLNTKK